MLEDIWGFLKDPANRTVLAWIGGGIVAVAGGLWTAIRFFAGKGEGRPSPSAKADNSSVAIGRDATNSPIHVNKRGSAKRLKNR
jgi:hypothetical protein